MRFSPKSAHSTLARGTTNLQDDGIRHIGPMAQDFYAAFGIGESDTTITTIDADGVLFAAVQELAKENTELKSEMAELKRLMQQMIQLGLKQD
ncbi:MAG: hypothetical protein IPK53_04070 [bacterium]|nr:hypothetical protein [bacterium]